MAPVPTAGTASAPQTGQAGSAALDARLQELSDKVDTVAGAVAAVAASQNQLIAQGQQLLESLQASARTQREDLEAVVEALTATVDAVEGAARDHDDRLGGLRDALTAPLTDLQALLSARISALEARLEAMADRLDAAPAPAPASADVAAPSADPATATAAAGIDDLRSELAATARDLRHHTDVALAGTIRVLDERFEGLRRAVAPAEPQAGAPPGGFETGAVLGAVQAAWSRLEQRLDHEFDALGRQLLEMDRRIEQALATAEAAANRPVVTGEQLRRTASSVKEAVLAAREQRRLRRGTTAPKGLGSG